MNNRIEELLQKYSQQGKKNILAFRGFPSKFVVELLNRPEALIPAKDVLDDMGWLKVEQVAESGEALKAALQGRETVILLYEQLLVLESMLPWEEWTVRIVDNNVFSQYYPCFLSPETAQGFLCGLEQGEPDSLCLTFYGDIRPVEEGVYLTVLRNCHTDRNCEEIPFYFQENQLLSQNDAISSPLLETTGTAFLQHCIAVQEGMCTTGGRYLIDEEDGWKQPQLQAFFCMLDEKEIPYSVVISEKEEQYHGERFLPLLQKYWGKEAAFRPLQFYRFPKENREVTCLSQGEIIDCIASQCDGAFSGESFRNVFVTAPTGAGKSVLFQLPALYLAEQYQAVTIVVTPLKALMKDQVSQLEKKQGVTCAVCLHSDITFEEREERIRQIHNGEKSIVYLSPELLISCELSEFIGERPLGLFVVDEAHTVTSWGKDFRVDYWYLGEYLQRLRRAGRKFPVLCLTATAVYGGEEDVVNETIESLQVEHPILYLGRVRRDNITFDIRALETPSTGIDKFKIQTAAEQTREFVSRGEKTLFYFPYTSQVDETYTRLEAETRRRVRKFHSRMQPLERNLSQLAFQKNDCDVMLSTKAFGMGVDISDIHTVCHFAPTGNLADYVQEIGRGARDSKIQGRAVTAFAPSDIRYMSTLYRLSELRQFQIRELLRKVSETQRKQGGNRITISPDEFSYLFPGDDDSLQNKVKNGLLLLSSDLEKKYGFPVIRMLASDVQESVNYVNVPEQAEKRFLQKYGAYAQYQPDETKLVIRSRNRFFASDTVVRNSGKIYRLDMGGLWRGCFQDINYTQFKRKFFAGDLFQCGGDQPLVPRSFISVQYNRSFDESVEEMKRIIRGVSAVFRGYKLEKKAFSQEEFRLKLVEELGGSFDREEFTDLLLDMFVTDAPQKLGGMGTDKSKFIAFRKAADGETGSYRVLNTGYITLESHFMHLLTQAVPDDEGLYQAYIPSGRSGKQPTIMKLFSLLELLGIASYTITGGRGQEITLLLSDPKQVHTLSRDHYVNHQVEEIHRRHLLAEKTMRYFLSGKFDSEKRWDMIEEYFLGRSFLPVEK